VAIDRDRVQANAQKFIEKKKYDKAVAEYQKIIQEDPNDARTLLKIGDLQSKGELFAQAIETYERVGKYYASQGFALKAIAVYKQIKELVAKHVPQLEERYGHIAPKLAELYQQLGLTSDALSALDEVATRLQRKQQDKEAIQVFHRIVELDPTNPLPHLRLAEAFSRVEDVDGAVTEFGVAASLLVKLGRRDDAIKVFERLLHHKPDPVNARLCAELYLERSMPQDGMLALAKLQLCFQANPKDLDTLALLARAFGAIGQAAKGIEVQKEMARLAKEQGKPELFKQLVEKLQRLAPNDEAVIALANTGANVAGVAPLIRDAPRTGGADELSYDRLDSQEIQEASLNTINAVEDAEPSFELVSDRPPPPSAPRYADGPVRPGSAAPSPPRKNEDSYGAAPDVLVDTTDGIVEIIDEDDGRPDVREEIAQVLTDAASFRRVRLYAKAIETLRGGLELDPVSREVREALRDLLLETRHYDEAASEMLVLASLQIDTGDVEGAARALYDVLAIDASNPRAVEMLQGLGYEVPGMDRVSEAREAPPIVRAGTYDPEAPLPSYEMEDSAEARGAAVSLDEPFDGEEDAPLPSFPLEGPESEVSFDLVQGRSSAPPPPAADQSDGFARHEATTEARSPGELEEALEEADFFASRGLFDDARTILNEQLALHPNHMLLKERLAELDSQEQSARGGSGTRQVPKSATVDRSFDIAASLDAIENLDTTSGVPPAFEPAGKEVDVEEVFAKFKEGVAKQVSVDDAQSHYDLGVAYKEMGLVEDAVREFDTAARDAKRECVCRSMIGMIHMERGKVGEAIDAFQRGLHAHVRTPEQETVLCYEIGAAYEATKRSKDALNYFQKVARRDPSYRDVQERIVRLAKADNRPAPRAAAVGADDEFDRAFDEIIGGSKLP
jgi:tetratricopeptide (TPR) repeat protein